MGNSVCCKRQKKSDISSQELTTLIKEKIKTKSKKDLVLKINNLKTKRTGDIVFCILMGASTTITIIVAVSGGAAFPPLISGVIVSSGASLYYGNEIHQKNKLINMYEKELEKRK
tara:strand:+ start:1289 stop:1633 length:345 start_codon:yes stop_codon:yes gene_type:complete